MKGNQPRRHHYVPQFYQKGFADADERLWLYDRRTQKYAHVHPANICCENELYTIDPEGGKNRFIELEWLSKVDSEGSAAIRQFRNGVRLDPEWKESFSVYIAQQITRTPAFRDMTARNYAAMHQEYLRVGFTDVDRAKQLLENYREQTGDASHPDVTAESLVAAVVGGHIHMAVNEGAFLTHMVKQVEFLARWISAFEWETLRASVGTGFIICDYPFVVVPPHEHPEAIGLSFPGTVKYFPLTKALCLRMGERDYGFSYRSASKEEVRVINQNIAVNSERFVMGPSRAQLEHVVARSGTIALDPAPRTAVDVVQRDRDSGLIRFTFWPRRRYFYPKT